MFPVGKQVLLTDISDVAAVGILGEQMIKRLVFCGSHGFRYRLIPVVAVGEHGVYVEYNAAKVEYAVPHDVANRKLRFNHVRR